MTALRDHVPSELLRADTRLPVEARLARAAARLQDHHGLTEAAALEAVYAWHAAAGVLAGMPDVELPRYEPEPPPPSSTPEIPEGVFFDTPWALMGIATAVCAVCHSAVVWRFSMWHGWNNLAEWATETVLCAGALAGSSGILALLSAGYRRKRRPRHHLLSPAMAAFALLCDSLAVFTPAVTVPACIAVWGLEWWLELHFSGSDHVLSFHLGRILQSLVLAGALSLWYWIASGLTARVAGTRIRA
jgi:hypothetical protein